MYMITQVSFIWRGMGMAHVPLAACMFMTNSMLLWWTLDSVPLSLVIKPKVGNEARNGHPSGERSAKLRQSNRTDLRTELTMQLFYFY